MSYILEALKKAEREREFGKVPGIHSPHDLPSAPRPPRRWPWVLAAALSLNALLVAGFWWHGSRDDSDAAPPASTLRPVETLPRGTPDIAREATPGDASDKARRPAHEPSDASAPAAEVAAAPAPPPDVRLARPAPSPDSLVTAVVADPVETPPAMPASPPVIVNRRPLRPLPLAAPAVPPVASEPEPGATIQAGQAAAPPSLPTVPSSQPAPVPMIPRDVVELRPARLAPSPAPEPEPDTAWLSLPSWPIVPPEILRQVTGRLVLNVHVYSDRPAERFVLLNMKKYREGERIAEGPTLEEITRGGVILAVPDGRFRLRSR
ncbi:MAG: general secretion pathway protein GspB [Chromatiaceae bacterium]|nr:general secretion pathway protein GspB [Gammaproteobacteria bacterium]MCP5300886.1 general secretion pathway protein GspB [Chromatiaceae bacterium]MCP5421641.1 general secretion pathway protein GspB [Chromatiaceae bacterium]